MTKAEQFKLRYNTDEQFREYTKARVKEYKRTHKERMRAWNSKPEAVRKRKLYRKSVFIDPKERRLQRLKCIPSEVISRCAKGLETNVTLRHIGCSSAFLKQHFESMFKSGMRWDNYGKWEIDHVIPLRLAGKDEKVLLSLHHWTNIRPVWRHENVSKGGSLNYDKDMRVANA